MVEDVCGTHQIKTRDGTMIDFSKPFRRINVLEELERKTEQPLPNLEDPGKRLNFSAESSPE